MTNYRIPLGRHILSELQPPTPNSPYSSIGVAATSITIQSDYRLPVLLADLDMFTEPLSQAIGNNIARFYYSWPGANEILFYDGMVIKLPPNNEPMIVYA